MTLGNALTSCGLSSLDAQVLMVATLGKDRSWIIAHADEPLNKMQQRRWEGLIKRRINGEPVAYIIGMKEFYGRQFLVDYSTLIPRPATEGLIEIIMQWCGLPMGRDAPIYPESHRRAGRPFTNETTEIDQGIIAFTQSFGDIRSIKTIIDIGTGSGCIGITLALEMPSVKIIATDTSDQALMIAEKNIRKWEVGNRVELRQGSLLEPIQDLSEPFIIVSNPPYIPDDSDDIDPDVKDFEPPSALFAGKDGLEVIRPMIEQAKMHPFCRGIALECRADQGERIREMM